MTRSSLLRTAVTFAVVAAVALSLSIRRPNLQARTVVPAALDSVSATPGGDDDTVYELDWRALAGLDVRTGTPTPYLRQLDGRTVRIPGYIVPLDDFADEVTEFLLVPYFGACIHTPPPPPNQMVQVRVGRGAHASTSWERPVWIEGRLAIKAVLSPYGVVAFTMRAEKITPYAEPR
jgi:uncharacterized protein